MTKVPVTNESEAAVGGIVISVVTDSLPGPAADHGAGKILEALRSKGIAAERVTSLEAARGDILIVTGLASGGGPAAGLLNASKIPAPTGPALMDGMEYFIETEDASGRRSTFPRDGGLRPIRVTVTGDREPPTISHTPVRECAPGEPLKLIAEVKDPSGVKWVRLRYRGVNQHQDYRTLRMLPTGAENLYQAEIPAGHIRPEWDLMYFIEAMDNCGNGRIYPDLEVETPYVVVRLKR